MRSLQNGCIVLVALVVGLGSLAWGQNTRLTLPHGVNLPRTCKAGDVYVDTNAIDGHNLYVCLKGQWIRQGDDLSAAGTILLSCTILIGAVTVPESDLSTLTPPLEPCRITEDMRITEIAVKTTARVTGLLPHMRVQTTVTPLVRSPLTALGTSDWTCATPTAAISLDGVTSCTGTLQPITVPAGASLGFTAPPNASNDPAVRGILVITGRLE